MAREIEEINNGNFRMKDNYRDPEDKTRFNEKPKRCESFNSNTSQQHSHQKCIWYLYLGFLDRQSCVWYKKSAPTVLLQY